MKRKGNYYTAPVTNARLAAQWAAARWPSPHHDYADFPAANVAFA